MKKRIIEKGNIKKRKEPYNKTMIKIVQVLIKYQIDSIKNKFINQRNRIINKISNQQEKYSSKIILKG